MPRRHPQPFWRKSRSCWYVQIGKRQKSLSPDRDEAFRLYHELMIQPQATPAPSSVRDDDPLVVEVCDVFLHWLFKRKVMTTYRWHKHYIQMFGSSIPRDLRVSKLTPLHVTDEMDAHEDWQPNTKWDFARAVQRVFNWAVDQKQIPASPIRRVEKPTPEAGELAISPAQFAEAIAAIREPNFRELIRFC
jgi:hypothetical protein